MKIVLGWTRARIGNDISWHKVEIANCVTSHKAANTQNYIKEMRNIEPMNTNKEGHAKCITATYYKDGQCNIHGHHKGNAVKDYEPIEGTDEVKESETRYRIRKLTERECFRLMGVDDSDIDKIQASGVSRSAQYKLAGNSIVVDVLYEIFRKSFVEPGNESRQLTLF